MDDAHHACARLEEILKVWDGESVGQVVYEAGKAIAGSVLERRCAMPRCSHRLPRPRWPSILASLLPRRVLVPVDRRPALAPSVDPLDAFVNSPSIRLLYPLYFLNCSRVFSRHLRAIPPVWGLVEPV